jgi:GT2 family glycosyltransferase
VSRRARVLLAVTVYNGRAFVPRALESAQAIDRENVDVDVLVLDDCSPEPGFSELISNTCQRLGHQYYRSPRNLGIVRNVNLGLLAAVEDNYDYVIISNSDVIYSRQTVDFLVQAALSDPRIGSVTAWSNNVSVFSLSNTDPDRFLAKQEVVDWLAASLGGQYRGIAVDVPAGISFCILVPTPVVREVGLMDPVFGRGYCEETDWTLRSQAMGYRITLAPAAFVYHQGRGSTVAAGMLAGGHNTVWENEAIIDHRYPLFRTQVDAYVKGGLLDRLRVGALGRIVSDAGRQFGYFIQVGPGPEEVRGEGVRVEYLRDKRNTKIRAIFAGFEMTLPERSGPIADVVRGFFDKQPAAVTVVGVGPSSHVLAKAFGVSVDLPHPTYPTSV